MKTKQVIMLAILILFAGLLKGQTLSERLGSVKTNFQFYSDTVALNVTDQFLLKNAGGYSTVYYSSDNSYAYAAGYESFHLEFITYKPLTREILKGLLNPDHYRLEFYDSENNKLSTMKLHDKVSVAENPEIKGSPAFYSIDLYEIPISLLDKTTKINIIKAKHASSGH